MAYYRRLPSGKWQATVRGPDGRKHTRTDKLRDVVRKWATDQESKFSNGDVRDPRAGDIQVREWHQRYVAAAVLEAPTVKKRVAVVRPLRADVGDVEDVRGQPDGGAGLGRPTSAHGAVSVERRRHGAHPVGDVQGGDEGDAAGRCD